MVKGGFAAKEKMMLLFDYLIFPGFLFTVSAGLLAGWIDRKVTARIQWRVGPPWYQNFVDIVKLLGKEVTIPKGAGAAFLLSPYLGLLSAVLVATIVGKNLFSSSLGFQADLIVLLYLLIMPAIAVILGASSSRNPLASVGASREIKLVLSYELPFILAIIALAIRAKGSIQLAQILSSQASTASNIFSWSGFLAFIVVLLCIQAKLGLAPFDIAEAEQEIMAGTLIEYSGLPLAVFRLTKAALLYTMPVLVILLFLGKDTSPLFIILKFIAILVLIILIKNTN
ncbi:MAG: NADH-quinone oxidoreductase subunit H, partial [Candidatus Omnitrophica bacterium]|nr:NADH-quinone oxidoreductase subunit H [Candidatus Omnitrophota bacterium]